MVIALVIGSPSAEKNATTLPPSATNLDGSAPSAPGPQTFVSVKTTPVHIDIEVEVPPIEPAVSVQSANSMDGGRHLPYQTPTVSIILLDAYSTIAVDELWPALFSLHLSSLRDGGTGQPKIRVWAGMDAAAPVEGASALRKVRCTAQHAACTAADVSSFCAAVTYTPLDSAADYAKLCGGLNVSNTNTHNMEIGRIFYLPQHDGDAVVAAAKAVGKHCDAGPSSGWLRVAVATPIGVDRASATTMEHDLSAALRDDQLFRVDAVLGLPGVQQIYDFRDANSELDQLLCRDFVEKVEIVLAESEGHTVAYDAVGVLRDQHQTHLTEVLALLGIDLDHIMNPDCVQHEKEHFLESVQPVLPKETALYQYDGYTNQCRADLGNPTFEPTAPTLAITTVHAQSERWTGVPFHLLAGAKLGQSHGYVRVQFGRLPVLGGALVGISTDENTADRSQLVFHLYGGVPARPPAVYIGSRVGGVSGIRVRLPRGWTSAPPSTVPEISRWVGNIFHPPEPAGLADTPYDALFAALYHGDRSKFVGGAALLQSWRIWDAVIRDSSTAITVHNTGVNATTFLQTRAKRGSEGTHDEL